MYNLVLVMEAFLLKKFWTRSVIWMTLVLIASLVGKYQKLNILKTGFEPRPLDSKLDALQKLDYSTILVILWYKNNFSLIISPLNQIENSGMSQMKDMPFGHTNGWPKNLKIMGFFEINFFFKSLK